MKRYYLIMLFLMIFSSCRKHSGSYPILSKEPVTVAKLFAEGIISTKVHNEFNIAFAPDGRTIYLTRRPTGSLQKIYSSKFQNGSWSEPGITDFSTARDEAPFVSPDGKTIYFGSTRPIEGRPSKGTFDMNLWKVIKRNDAWQNPVPLDSTISKVQQEGEQWPSSNESSLFTIDGKTFYFSTMLRGSKAIQIYRTELSKGTFSKPVEIEGLLEGDYWKSSPCISPDGNYLLFNAYGVQGGYGGEDIYVSKREGDSWSKAKGIGPLVNTASEEGSAAFSPDGKYFFFSRDFKETQNEDGIYSIYFIETEYLHLEKLFILKK